MEESSLRLGVVGYCPPTKFDIKEARRMLKEAYHRVEQDFLGRKIIVVSGLTNVGVPKLAYEEARKKGWKTAGVACERARDFEWFPVDEEPVIVGNEWGQESETFLYGTKILGQSHEKGLDAIIRIGLGKQSLREAEVIREMGKPTYEYDLSAIK